MRVSTRVWAPAAIVAVGVVVAACALGVGGGEGEPCLEDSPACVQLRVGMVNAMASDPQRSWIQEAPSRVTIASGIRLFAYAKTQATLSCDELAAGIREMEAAQRTLAQGKLPGQSAERHNQVKALTADTHASLSQTRRKKCGA